MQGASIESSDGVKEITPQFYPGTTAGKASLVSEGQIVMKGNNGVQEAVVFINANEIRVVMDGVQIYPSVLGD